MEMDSLLYIIIIITDEDSKWRILVGVQFGLKSNNALTFELSNT